jgi:arylsulfatase/uncharacterized sulfatase
MTGRSLLPLLRGGVEAVYGPDDPVGVEVSGQAALFKGDYKLERNNPPYGDGVWRLYDMVRDPGETRDLAEERPDLFSQLMSDYEAYVREMGVLEMPEGYGMYDQLHINTVRNMVRYHRALLLVLLAVICAGLLWAGRRLLGRIRRAA